MASYLQGDKHSSQCLPVVTLMSLCYIISLKYCRKITYRVHRYHDRYRRTRCWPTRAISVTSMFIAAHHSKELSPPINHIYFSFVIMVTILVACIPWSWKRVRVVIPTGRYSNRSIFRQVDSPTNWSIFRQVDIPTKKSIFRPVYIM